MRPNTVLMESSATAAPHVSLRPARSLLPKEHGAWPQLLVPLVTALIVAPSAPGALLAGAAIAAFLTHEPALVLLGHRGEGALDRDGPRAMRWTLTAGFAATSLSAVALALRESTALWLGCALSGALALALGALVLRRSERSDLGECLAATALSSVSLVVLLAAGASWSRALSTWAVWTVGFIAITGAVRAALAPSKKRDPAPSRRVAIAGVIAALIVAPFTAGASSFAALSAGALLVRPPAHKHIRRAGWALAGATIATALWLIATSRA